MDKVCPNCGETFSTDNPNKKFCCYSCRQTYYRKIRKEHPNESQVLKPRTCPICGKRFTPKVRNDQKYCCRDCKEQYIRNYNRLRRAEKHQQKEKIPEPRVCPVCGKTFIPKNNLIKYCSPQCHHKYDYSMFKERLQGKKAPFYNPRQVYIYLDISVSTFEDYFSEAWIEMDKDKPWYQKHTCTLMSDPYPV